MELVGHGSALPGEEIIAHHRAPAVHLVVAGLLNQRRYVAGLSQVELNRYVVEAGQRQRHFAQVRVSGALADAVDGALHPVGARPHRRDCKRRSHCEIVVPVEVQWNFGPDPLPNPADQVFHRLRSTGADRVHHGEFGCAGVERPAIDFLQETEIAAGAVHGEEDHPHAVVHRVLDPVGGPLQDDIPVEAVGFHLDFAGGNLDQGAAYAELDQRIQVGAHSAGEAPDLRRQPGVENALDRPGVGFGNSRESRLDAADAQLVQRAGDLEFLLRREDHAHGLLAVAKRGVVELHRGGSVEPAAHLLELVQLAGPIGVRHFSDPPDVIHASAMGLTREASPPTILSGNTTTVETFLPSAASNSRFRPFMT